MSFGDSTFDSWGKETVQNTFTRTWKCSYTYNQMWPLSVHMSGGLISCYVLVTLVVMNLNC